MILVAHEAPWESRLTAKQHFFNEACFYLLCISLVAFCGVITDATLAHSLGLTCILLICGLILGNICFILCELQ